MGSMQNREVSPTGLDPDISKMKIVAHIYFFFSKFKYVY